MYGFACSPQGQKEVTKRHLSQELFRTSKQIHTIVH